MKPVARHPAAFLVVPVLALTVVGMPVTAPAWSHGSRDVVAATRTGDRACSVTVRLSRWSVRRLAEQTVVVPVEEDDVAAARTEVEAGAGGVILFGSQAPADLARRLRQLVARAPHGIAPVVMTDEEGGTVQRMPDLVGSLPSARHMGADWTPRHIRSAARHLAVRMSGVGVSMDLAPVLDLDGRAGPDTADPIGTRSFSPRRAVATRDGLAFADGLVAGGVVPVVKHFPGIGGAHGNSDLGAASTPPWHEVRHNDLRPFRSAIAAGVPAVMVSNASVPGLTSAPASVSRAVVHRVLRQQLGFDGLVVPDSLTAGAISAAGLSLTTAAVRGIAVGEDMVLFTATPEQLSSTTHAVVHALVAAVQSGSLGRRRLEAAVAHVLAAKGVDLCAA